MRSRPGRMGVLVLTVAVGAFMAASAFAGDAEYVGNSKCKLCHNKKSEGEQWNKWKSMKHASAFVSLSTDAAKESAANAGVSGSPAEAAECVKCHVTGHDSGVAALKKEDGVQCESCHGPASLHLDFGKKAMTNKEAAATMDMNIIRPDSAVCEECHNEESPFFAGYFDFDEMYAQIYHSKPKD